MADTQAAASGVQALIGKLRDEGVQAGQREAGRILDEAQKRAAQLVADAKSEAEAILDKARAEIEAEQAAAREGLKLAVRDTELALQSEVRAAFAGHLKRLVRLELEDKDFLRSLILAVAGAATADVPENQRLELLLPADLFVKGPDGARLTEEGLDRLRHLVLAISGEMLREGVELNPGRDIRAGVRVRLVGEDLEIDLTDSALSDLLLKHLTPRLGAIVQGLE
jgi:V/A-type H+-transporting ATPase subunit E